MEKTEAVFYKIRDSRTGLFHSGRKPPNPAWSKKGKAWPNTRSLFDNLYKSGLVSGSKVNIPFEWEVVPFLVVSEWKPGHVLNARESYMQMMVGDE
jgi:hypothetical protein